MSIWTSAVIPAVISLAVAAISYPVVAKMQHNHEENLLRHKSRSEKLHNWKIFISDLLYEFPRNVEGFRSRMTYKDIEVELPPALKAKVRQLVLVEDYKSNVADDIHIENMRQLKAALEEILEFLAKLGKDWKIQ
jgi:hypothetical protein